MRYFILIVLSHFIRYTVYGICKVYARFAMSPCINITNIVQLLGGVQSFKRTNIIVLS